MRSELEARYPTLHMVGRNGMHRYNNQDHAMMTAMLTVRTIVAGEKLCDIWGVNEDAEYHESGTEGEQAHLAPVREVPQRVAKAPTRPRGIVPLRPQPKFNAPVRRGGVKLADNVRE